MGLRTATLFAKRTALVLEEALARGGSWVGGQTEAENPQALQAFFDYSKTLPAPVIFDIGANTGSYSLLARHHLGMRVYAFEPVADLYHLLLHHISLNNLGARVMPLRLALSDYSGYGTMGVPPEAHLSGFSMLNPDGCPEGWITEGVRVYSLDEFCSLMAIPRVHMIKIDVEGMESAVLAGGKALVERDHPYLFIEYPTPQRTACAIDIQAWVEERGYHCRIVSGQLEAVYAV